MIASDVLWKLIAAGVLADASVPRALPAPKEPKADPARLSALLQRAHAALTRPI